MNKKDRERQIIQSDIKVLRNQINRYWYSYLIVTQAYQEIRKLKEKLDKLG